MVSVVAARALYAALLLAIACSLDGRLRFVAALPLVIAAFVLSCAAMSNRAAGQPAVEWRGWAVRGLAAMAAIGIVLSGADGVRWYEVARRLFAVLALAVVVVAAGDDLVWRRRAVNGAVLGTAIIALLTPPGTPAPGIDVVTWTVAAINAFVHGIHPYTVQAADVYGGARDFGFTVRVYPYMPATLLALAPWHLVLGDFRIGLAVCLPITVWLMRSAGARAGTDLFFVDVATLALILHPSAPRVIRSGWTEPLLMLSAAAFAYLAVHRPRGAARAAVFFLQPALKQYVVAPTLMCVAACAPGRRGRTVIIGAVIAAVTIGPFLLWNAAATIDGILFQIRAPTRPRLTAISIPSLLANLDLPYPPFWVSMAAQMIVGTIAYLRIRAWGAGGLLLASAVSLLATFLLGWQAFVNYYYYIGALLVIASVLLAAPKAAAA